MLIIIKIVLAKVVHNSDVVVKSLLLKTHYFSLNVGVFEIITANFYYFEG